MGKVVEGGAKLEADSSDFAEALRSEEESIVEEVEEVDPLDLIASLERDLSIAIPALRKILRINPALFKGGPSNQYFGRKHEQAFEIARVTAFEALERLENHINDNE